MNTKVLISGVSLIVALAIGFAGGYLYGNRIGYQQGDLAGYARAEADVKKVQEEAARKAVRDVAEAANPFRVENPLSGVEANPFEKAKKVLNPFE